MLTVLSEFAPGVSELDSINTLQFKQIINLKVSYFVCNIIRFFFMQRGNILTSIWIK